MANKYPKVTVRLSDYTISILRSAKERASIETGKKFTYDDLIQLSFKQPPILILPDKDGKFTLSSQQVAGQNLKLYKKGNKNANK
jgi:hypothetical protein